MDETPIGVVSSAIKTSQLKEPLTQLRLSAEWNTRALGDAATEANLNEIYYADSRRFSLLLGIWEQKESVVWGQ